MSFSEAVYLTYAEKPLILKTSWSAVPGLCCFCH